MGQSKRGSESGAKSANAEWFASDIVPGGNANRASLIRLSVCYTAAADVEYTRDSGSTWCKLNGGSDLAANSTYFFDMYGDKTDEFNFRSTSGVTLSEAIVIEVQ